MLKHMRSLFESLTASQNATDIAEPGIEMAAAVLLVEVMMADHHIAEEEKIRLNESIQVLLDIDTQEADELIELAQDRHDNLVSLHEMTKVINLHYKPEDKISLIEHMWKIAYADQRWDKYEEHLIRKVSDLLYVSHKDFIRAKHKAQCDE